MKKIFSLILSLVLIISVFQFTVVAEYGAIDYITTSDWVYYVDSQTSGAVLCTYLGSASTLTVPSTINGTKVYALATNLFSDSTTVKNITVANGITEIQSGCFAGCVNLESVTIPNSVVSVGTNVFSTSAKLKTVKLGNGIKEITDEMFYGCSSLTSVTLGSSVDTISRHAFKECYSLENFTIPSTVTYIGTRAFQNCSKIKSISIPAKTSYVGHEAFDLCKSLSSFSLGNSNAYLGRNILKDTAFYNNSANWTNGCLVVNKCLLAIKDQNTLDVPQGVAAIASEAFTSDVVKTINMPSSLNTLHDDVFLYATSLEAINVAEGNSTFLSTDGLFIRKSDATLLVYPAKKINSICKIPNTVKKIGENAVSGNTYIKSLVLPSSVNEIGEYAFSGCTNLATVSLSETLKTIGGNAFYECTSLKEMAIPDSVVTVGEYCFSKCNKLFLVTTSNKLTNLSIGVFSDCTSLTNISLGNKLTSIPMYAFSGCVALRQITIPSSVKKIEYSAFFGCTSLTKISTCGSIDSRAFDGCTSLNTVKITEGASSVGDSAFNGCKSLKTLELPKSLKYIGSNAFYGCDSLNSVTIYDGVENIGYRAFGYTLTGNLNTNLVISGYNYSAAQDYAESVGITFKSLDVPSPGSIAFDYDKGIIYLGGLKVAPSHFQNFLKQSYFNCQSITTKDGASIPSGKYIGTNTKAVVDDQRFTLVIKGDTSGDGLITTVDYLQIKQNFMKTYTFDEYSKLAADVDPNGKIDTTDYIRIKLHFLGEYDIFGNN